MIDFLWGLWNGITAWPLLVLHVFGIFVHYPVFDVARNHPWYQFGFLLGSGSPLLGLFGRRSRVVEREAPPLRPLGRPRAPQYAEDV